MVDFVAQRYGILPSELLERGSSIDVVVSGVAQQWAIEQQRRAQAAAEGKPYVKPPPKIKQQDLEAMLARARAKD